MGKPFQTTEGGREGFIMFSMETGSFSGNNTCNNFFGQYDLMEENRISFGSAGSTRMACPDQDTERLFMEALQMADNYTVADNVLSLNTSQDGPPSQV